MPEHLAPSNQKYSDDPAEQAFVTHVERRTLRLGTALIGHLSAQRIIDLASLQDFVWEQALEFVAPMEPEVRDELRRAGTDLPWAHRLDPELYWLLMYVAHVERILDTQVAVFDERTVRRPLKQVISATTILLGQLMKPEGGSDPDFLTALRKPGATSIGRSLYQGVIDRASREIRLRSGRQRAPKPLELSARVRAGNALAIVEGYGFDGSVTLSRETDPDDRGGLVWTLDVKSGRWQAKAWPWLLEPIF
jgi:hypothetical protein